MADLCGHILTESGDRILCENGDALVTECFAPTPTTPSLMPGKVWKGEYPYFKRRRKPAVPYRSPYGRPKPYDYREEEEVLIMALIDLD